MQFYKIIPVFLVILALVVSACTPTAAPGADIAGTGDQTAMETDDMMPDEMDKDDDMMSDEMDKDDDMISDEMYKDDDMMSDEMDKDDDMMSDEMAKDDDMMDDDKAKDDDMMKDDMDKDEAMMDSPAWFKAGLTDVRSGEEFTIEDFHGQVILVETMATWCPSCLRQQNEVKALHEKLGMRSDFVSLGLNVDPHESADLLKSYIDSRGFDWLYAVAPREVHREIGDLYGTLFLNPSSTPMFIIDREGMVHLLPFGIKSADDLYEALQPFLGDGM
jgi:thiol-disulfide isomerase/thioredoxin